ncbi:MAG: hypothetical protein GC131_02560 [Alphaproteobacteria bacterium]|nr:hypothetical protein [Alphaproteobacteria bacterium]
MALVNPKELLKIYAEIVNELQRRGITRSANNPAGDVAELLFCRAFNWRQENNSKAGFDAIDAQGMRYQIKARRITTYSKSRQMSAIRDLGGAPFDFLAGLLFDESYEVTRAAIIPRVVVVECSKYVDHTHSHRFLLRDNIWDDVRVRDVTKELRAVVL